MSETNVQLFPGVFRSTVGGANPGFFLHSDGRVGIGNTAPTTRPVWSSDDNDRNKLNVSGHTHIEGNLNVSGYVYGDGSNLTGTAVPWQQSTPNLATDIKYDNGGNVGIGGAAGTNKLKVHGTVEATSFTGIQAADVPTLSTSKISGLANSATIEATTANTADRIALRNGSGDIQTRLFRSSYPNETHGISSSAFAYRVNDGNDNYIRFCSDMGQLRSRLGLGFLATVSSYPTATQTNFQWQQGGNGHASHASYGGYGDWYIRSNHSSGKVIIQDSGGNVGIGRSNPGYRLDVEGSGNFRGNLSTYSFNCNDLGYFYSGLRVQGIETANLNYSNPQADYFTNGGSIQADAPNEHYGLYVQYHIRAEGISVTSDERIKRDFMEIDDAFALDKLRQFKLTSYMYKEKVRSKTNRVLGFIAQEVAEVLPDAVSITRDAIPNIQIEASVKKIDENKFELTLKEPHSVNVGAILAIRAPKLPQREVEVVSVIDDTTFTIFAEEFDIDRVGDRVWVHGEYVDDFHNLNKDAIWTVTTSALQEVDRQLQAEKEKVKSLEERLATLEAIVLNQ